MRILLDNLIILIFMPIWCLIGFRLGKQNAKAALESLKEEAARHKDALIADRLVLHLWLITRAYEVLDDINRKELQAQVNTWPKRESI